MTDWVAVMLKSRLSTSTFSAIGHPFAFTWRWTEEEGRFLQCFENPAPRCTMAKIPWLGYTLHERKRDDKEELFEDGWYLSGIGHHELWCGTTLPEAVTAAQEHIAWDGSDPTRVLVPPMKDESGEIVW
jgi:hypothetical protein